MSGSLKLVLTPQSHFSRKVRIVLTELKLECEFIYVQNLLSTDPSKFAGNPILRVPVLKDGEHMIVESDSIVRYLLEKYESAENDRFSFFQMTSPQRNALSFISAIMGAEVELILSQRSGLPLEPMPHYFQRYREVIRHCLARLEREGAAIWPTREFSYLDIALICMWDHLGYNKLIDIAKSYSWINQQTTKHAVRESVASTTPQKMEHLQWELYPKQRKR